MTSSAAAPSTPTPTPAAKTRLRVGIVQARRIVEERVLESAGRVTIGTSGSSSFIVPSDALPARWRLFDRRGGGWCLHLGAGMTARIAMAGQVASFDGGDPSSGPRSIPLGDGARGKITL